MLELTDSATLSTLQQRITEPSGLNVLKQRRVTHLHHLRGKALYRLGCTHEALEELTLASKHAEDPCTVESWLPWLRAMHATEKGLEGAPSDRYEMLFAALRAADRALEQGNAAALGLPLGKLTWPQSKLAEIDEAAKTWLNESTRR